MPPNSSMQLSTNDSAVCWSDGEPGWATARPPAAVICLRACAGSVSVSAVDHHAGAVLREQCRDSRADTP